MVLILGTSHPNLGFPMPQTYHLGMVYKSHPFIYVVFGDDIYIYCVYNITIINSLLLNLSLHYACILHIQYNTVYSDTSIYLYIYIFMYEYIYMYTRVYIYIYYCDFFQCPPCSCSRPGFPEFKFPLLL